MRTYLTYKYHTYMVMAGLSILACIVFGRFEFILLGLPFLISTFLPAFETREPRYTLRYELSREECFEGDTIHVRIFVCAQTTLPVLEIRHLIHSGTQTIVENDRIVVS